MTCTRYKELISRYVDGEVTPRQRQDVLEHVQHCHDCAAWLARARQAEVLLKGVPETQPSDRVRDNILSAASGMKPSRSAPSQSVQHLPVSEGLRLYTSGLLLRYDTSPQRVVMAAAVAILSIIGMAYWLNMLPPIWGYNQFGFLFPREQEQVALTSTPIPAISSAPGGPIAVPNLLRLDPIDGTQEVKAGAPLHIGSDLPMDRPSIEDAIHIDPPVAGKFKWNYDNEVSFTPAGAGLLRGVTYTVNLSDTARSLAGTRTGKSVSWSFHTHRAYSTMSSASSGSLAPITGSFKLSFDAPMDTAQATRDVSLRMEDSGQDIVASYSWDTSARELTIIPVEPMPVGVLTLRVGADAATRTGDTLGRSAEFTYTVALPDTRLQLAGGRLAISQVDSPSAVSYEISTSQGGEVGRAQLKIYDVPAEMLSTIGAQAHSWPLGLPTDFPDNLSPSSKLSIRHAGQLTNPEAGVEQLVGRSPGTYLVAATAQSHAGALSDWQLLVITDRRIALAGDAAPFWVTDEAGKPWVGSEVSLYSPAGNLIEKGMTDGSGLWTPASAESSSATLAIARDPQGHLAAMTLTPKKQEAIINKGTLSATLQTDQPAYYPGQAINFRATVQSRPISGPAGEPGVSVSLLNPQGSPVSILSLKPDSAGGVTGLFTLASRLQPAQYILRVGFGSAWRDFPLAIISPPDDTLSVYIVPQQRRANNTRVLTETVSVLGPSGEPAANANLTATLRISGDAWVSAPVYATTRGDGSAAVTVYLPEWSALYNDPGMYLDVQASWHDHAGSRHIPLDLIPLSLLLSGTDSLVSPSLNIAGVIEPQKDGSARLRLVTLDGSVQPMGGAVLVQAQSPSGERQFWSVDLAALGGDTTLPLTTTFVGGKVYFMRAGVDGARELAMPFAQDANLSLSVDAPGTTAPGAPLPVELKLTAKNGQGAEGAASIWFRAVSGDGQPTERGWEPSAHIDVSDTLTDTVTVTAPHSPGLWYVFAEATTAQGAHTLSRTVVDVLPGPTIQLPTSQQLQSNAAQVVAISVYNPLDTPLSSGIRVEGDNSISIMGSTSQGVEVPAGGWQRLQWNFVAKQPGASTVAFSFLPSASVGGSWTLKMQAGVNTNTDINYAAGVLTGQRTVGVLVPSGRQPDSVQLEIRASTSLLSALADAASDLSAQSGSDDVAAWAAQLSAAPSVASAYQRVGSSSPARILASGVGRSLALQQLYSAQHADGGWGDSVDPSRGPSDPGKTSDVLLAMRRQNLAWAEAGKQPEPGIDETVTARALAYLAWQSARPVDRLTSAATFDEQARALATLSLYGAAKADAIRPLMAYASSSNEQGVHMSRTGVAWLALALWQAGDTGDALALVDRLLQVPPTAKDTASAPLLEVLVAASNTGWQGAENTPNTFEYRAEAREYAHTLMEMRHGARWSSPSLSADALWALSRYAAQEPDIPVGLPSTTLNDHTVQTSPQLDNTNTYDATLSSDALHAGANWLRLQAPTNQPLYYSLTLRASR